MALVGSSVRKFIYSYQKTCCRTYMGALPIKFIILVNAALGEDTRIHSKVKWLLPKLYTVDLTEVSLSPQTR